MERRETETEARENQKFWKCWEENQSILVVGDSQNNDLVVKTQIAEKLGLHKRSITPTTLEKVIFAKEESPFYEEIYSYKGNSVTRVGIDVHHPYLPKILEVNQQTLSKSGRKITMGSEIKSSINEKNVKVADTYKQDAQIMLTDFEKDIFTYAISILDNNPTVLIDIFARHDKDGVYCEAHKMSGRKYSKGEIKIDEEGSYETHTVVLYLQGEKYLVIDPSNSTFSTILVGVNDNIRVCFDPNLQIYKPQGKTGFNNDLWRDCIDIAVKIALGLNKETPIISVLPAPKESQILEFINPKVIKDIHTIKEITNQKEQYTYLPKLLEGECVRAKQSSDIQERKLTTLYLKALNSNSLSMKEQFDKIDAYETQKLLDNLNRSKVKEYKESHEEYIKNLQAYTSTLSDFISKIDDHKVMQLEEKAIMGELPDNIGEWI